MFIINYLPVVTLNYEIKFRNKISFEYFVVCCQI